MTIMPLGSGPTPPPDPTASASLPMDQLGQDTFLKLMVAQLRNQDPMNPQDSAEFLAQTAQFTSLEKLGTVADQTSQALAAQMSFGASTLAGKSVTYLDEDGVTELSGKVDSVSFTPTGPVLNVGANQVLLNSVVSVALQDPTA
ncbi:MAG: flagellar hook assembly protein FlgD [Nocardioides sp.]